MTELRLPKIGLGTWRLKGETCTKSVLKAIDIGYRHIDTAQMYGNEYKVGDALFQATIDRKELIVATKLAIIKLRPNAVKSSTIKSLEKLKVDYIDLLYVHWPAPFFYRPEKTLKALSELVDEGKIKHIGVSNFTSRLINEAVKACDKPIAANQVEFHPWLQQKVLREKLKELKINLVAYCPIAQGKVTEMPELKEIAKKYETNESQVALAWIIQNGAIPIPKATGEIHLQDNFEAVNLKLDQEDMEKINSIQKVKRLVNPPVVHPKWD